MIALLSRCPSVLLCAAMAWVAGPAASAQEPSAEPSAPVQGYVCLEPFEMRQEFVVELGAVQTRLGGQLPEILDADEQGKVLKRLSEVLATANVVRADGRDVNFNADQVQFVVMDPKLGPVLDDRTNIPRDSAILAASFSSEQPDYPGTLEIRWGLFPDSETNVSAVPVEVEVTARNTVHVDELTFTREDATQTWSMPPIGATPGLLAVVEVRSDNRTAPRAIAIAFIVLGVGLLGLALRRRSGERAGFVVASTLALLFGGGALFTVQQEAGEGSVEETEARMIVDALLNNIYHAFAYREESKVFDTLATSVDGPLLEKLYLDIRRGCELEELGGPRVKVLRVSVVSCDLQRVNDGGLKARVVWVSSGNVSHWGHSHRRRNQYRGDLRVRAIDGRWKVTGVDILDEQRT